jgi:hypothetical protein
MSEKRTALRTAKVAMAVVGLLPCLWSTPQLRAQEAKSAGSEAPRMEFVYEETVTLGASIHPGATPFGERNIVPITGGTFTGPRLRGKILPGGWDWQLASKSGCFFINANYMIQTDDGAVINVDNRGRSCPKEPGHSGAIYTTPVFEAPLGRYQWLNGGAYVGTLDVITVDGKPAVHIRFFRTLE